MKTYVITVSENFPKSHPRAGEPTEFEQSIRTGHKIHTIRNNVQLWLDRIERVKAGEAVLSIRKWSGKPYRSKQVELLQVGDYGQLNDINAQVVQLADDYNANVFTLGEKKFAKVPILTLAQNDGLRLSDFLNWFDGWKVGEEKVIIHFSEYSYKYVA